MKYCLDTSSLITPWRFTYPPDVFKGLWDKLAAEIAAGNIVSVDLVYKELQKGNDDLFAWLKPMKDSFKPLEQNVITEGARIVNQYPFLVDAQSTNPMRWPNLVCHNLSITLSDCYTQPIFQAILSTRRRFDNFAVQV